jgi:hypothetical protein
MPTLINSFSLSSTIGIGTDFPNKALTVVGDISASNKVYANSFFGDGSNLSGISFYNGTDVKELTGNWNSTFTTLCANSATWVKFQPNPDYLADDLSDVFYDNYRYSKSNSNYYYSVNNNNNSLWITRVSEQSLWEIWYSVCGEDCTDYLTTTSLTSATYPWQATWPSGTLVTKASAVRVIGQPLAVTGTEGTSQWAARADHRHPLPYQAPDNDDQNIFVTVPSFTYYNGYDTVSLNAQQFNIVYDDYNGYWPLRSNRKLQYSYEFRYNGGGEDPEVITNFNLSWTINGSVSAWKLIQTVDNQMGSVTTTVAASSLSNTTYPWEAIWTPSNTVVTRQYNITPLVDSLTGSAGISLYVSRADHTHPLPTIFATNNYVNSNFLNLTGGTISGATRINNNLTVFGNLTATGTTTFANTIFSVTSALSVVHVGSGPALWVGNNGTGDIASFYDIDQNIEVLHVGGNNGSFPNVGVKTSTPNVDFTVNGQISSNNTIWSANGNSNNWNSAFTSWRAASATSIVSFNDTRFSKLSSQAYTINGTDIKPILGNNTASAYYGYSNIGGGENNTVSGYGYSTVGGGSRNTINSPFSFIAGGSANDTKGFANVFILGTSLSASRNNFTYVNNLSSKEAIYSTSFYGDGSNLTGITASGGGLYLPLSGGTLTGGLSAPSLSANNFYGLGSEVILSDGISSNNTGNGSNSLALNFSNGVYVGGNGTLSATNIYSPNIYSNSLPRYFYLINAGGTITSGSSNFFGTQIDTLLPNSRYEIEYNLFVLKSTTSNSVTYTLSANGTFTSGQLGSLLHSGGTVNSLAAFTGPTAALPATSNMTAGSNYYNMVKATIATGANNVSVVLNASTPSGSITPGANSFRKITKIA